MDVLVGTAAPLRVDFTDPLGTLIPDANSVSYTVFATDGTQLIAPTAVTTTATDTGVSLSIAGSNNTVAAGRKFEKRTVVVTMTSGGRPYTYQVAYRVIPFLNMTVTPSDVRSVFGGDIDEVTDDEIDLVAAYFLVADGVVAANANATLAAALATGTSVEVLANLAIAGMAAIGLLPGLQAKLATQRQDGQTRFMRAAVDLKQIERQARGMVARGVAAAAGVDPTAPTFLSVADQPDPITTWCGTLSWP